MALHTYLPIYKVSESLFWFIDNLVTNMERDFKRRVGQRIADECVEITLLVFRANVATEKAPYLIELIERLQVIELLLRMAMNKKKIDKGAYANAIEMTTSIGKQATGWKNKSANRPSQGGQGFHG